MYIHLRCGVIRFVANVRSRCAEIETTRRGQNGRRKLALISRVAYLTPQARFSAVKRYSACSKNPQLSLCLSSRPV